MSLCRISKISFHKENKTKACCAHYTDALLLWLAYMGMTDCSANQSCETFNTSQGGWRTQYRSFRRRIRPWESCTNLF